MNKRFVRCAAALLALCCLAGCSSTAGSSESKTETVTLKLLLRGSATGLDRVLEELYAQMDDDHRWKLDITLLDAADYAQQLARSLTAHEDYDLVFDAQWLTLVSQSQRNSYKNLNSYFNNPDYPALQQAFTQEYLDANRINGEIYGIPFTNAYYDVPGIFYRKDLLQELNLGFDTITTREQMTAFWQALQAQGQYKPLTLGSRGFYVTNLPEITMRADNILDVNGWSFWDYPAKVVLSPDGSRVLDVVFPGDDPARFASFPEPYNSGNYLDEHLLLNAEYYDYCDPDDLLKPDGKTDFLAGVSASYEGTLGSGGSAQIQQQLRQTVPDAEVGFWAYDSAFSVENRTAGAIPVDYAAWNFLCIPAYSTDADQTMAFLDWLYSDWSRLDLFNYGVEGEDWESVGEDEYTLLENPEGAFSFPAYELAWSPQHHRLDASMQQDERSLMEYIYDESSYTPSPMTGFQLNTTPISIEMARLDALYEEYYTGFTHGAYGDQTAAKIAELHTRSEQVGLEKVRTEIMNQVQTHLDSRANQSNGV